MPIPSRVYDMLLSRYPIVLGKCVAGSDYDTVDARRETSGTNSGQIPYKDNVNYSL